MVGALTLGPSGQRDRARDLLHLDSLPGVGPARVRALVETFGSAAAALRAPAKAVAEIAGVEAARARFDPTIREDVDRALDRAARLGVVTLTWGSPRYPSDLLQLADPPPLLFLRGREELLERRPAVTVVGSRKVTVRGRGVAYALGRELAAAGAAVISGLALGTDGEAHRGALEGQGATVAVLGTGIDVAYPRTHVRLARAIAEQGLLVTEFPPGTTAAPYHFPRRNRILAALGADAVVVVEAGARSGSLITVDHALDLGREVWSVPGPIDGSACAGSNALLADGARVLSSIDRFVSEVAPSPGSPSGTDAGSVGASGPGRATRRGSAPGSEASLLHLLTAEALDAGEAAARLGRPLPEVLAELTSLELQGRVVRLPGARFRSAA